MRKFATSFPLALDSPDYHHPWGVKRDNTFNHLYFEAIRDYFKRPIKYLDLGTAGGGMILGALGFGHDAIGLEGSDYWLKNEQNSNQQQVNQWKILYGHSLFTCDISHFFMITQIEVIDCEKKDMKYTARIESSNDENHIYGFEIVGTPEIITRDLSIEVEQFDLITAWEVLEHIKPERLGIVFENVINHLNPAGGIFQGTISLKADHPEGVELHQTLKPIDWWINELQKYFSIVEAYPWKIESLPRVEAESFAFQAKL